VRQARAHPFIHPLPLVAEGSMITKAIQTDLVLLLLRAHTGEKSQAEEEAGGVPGPSSL
jgi:hypothetical protein